MNAIILFILFLLLFQFLAPFLYAYPLLGLVVWLAIIAWVIYGNVRHRKAWQNQQHYQQPFQDQQETSSSESFRNSSQRPHVDEKDIIDAEYTEREVK